MFSLLWSEHCAYKHSRKLLRRLPTEGERVVMGPGENAGAVDVGGGHAVAFKVESHNHPSAVEPFEGAATGVGGILRDVFALGARPIAILDSLRFGELDSRALAPPARRRGARDRPLRQLDRRAQRRRRDLLRGALRAQLPGQRDAALGRMFAARVPPGCTVLAGAELGGIPLVTAASLASGLPCIFIRNQKKDYGTAKQLEGKLAAGDRVMLVEDVCTTGGQVLEAAKVIEAQQAEVLCIVGTIDREEGARENIEAAGYRFESLFTKTDLGV